MHGQEKRTDVTEPPPAIESRRQRDDRQAQGLEHESLLRPVGDREPVEHDIQHGQNREDPDHTALDGVQRLAPRPIRHSPRPGPGQGGEPERGEPGVEHGEQDVAQRAPMADGQVVMTGAHRLAPVPPRPEDMPHHADFQRIEGIAGEDRVADEPVSSRDHGHQRHDRHPEGLDPARHGLEADGHQHQADQRGDEDDPDGLGSERRPRGQSAQDQCRDLAFPAHALEEEIRRQQIAGDEDRVDVRFEGIEEQRRRGDEPAGGDHAGGTSSPDRSGTSIGGRAGEEQERGLADLGQSFASPGSDQPGEPEIAVGREIGRRILPERGCDQDQPAGLPPSRRKIQMIDGAVADDFHGHEPRRDRQPQPGGEHQCQAEDGIPAQGCLGRLHPELVSIATSEPARRHAQREDRPGPGQHRIDPDRSERAQHLQPDGAGRPEDHARGQSSRQAARLPQQGTGNPVRAHRQQRIGDQTDQRLCPGVGDDHNGSSLGAKAGRRGVTRLGGARPRSARPPSG